MEKEIWLNAKHVELLTSEPNLRRTKDFVRWLVLKGEEIDYLVIFQFFNHFIAINCDNTAFLFVICSGKYKSEDKKKWDKSDSMEVDVESGASGAESSLSPNATEDDTPKVDPIKWSVSTIIKNIEYFYRVV